MDVEPKTIQRLVLGLCGVILFWVALNNLGAIGGAVMWLLGALSPVLLGFAVAFLLSPFAGELEKALGRGKLSPSAARTLSVALVYLVVAAALTLILVLIVPQLRDAYATLVATVPGQLRNGIVWLDETAQRLGVQLDFLDSDEIDWQRVTESLASLLPAEGTGDLVSRFLDAAGSLVGAVADLVLGAVIGFHLLLRKEKVGLFYRRLVRAFSSEKAADSLFDFVTLCTGAFRDFMTGQFTEALAIGFMACVGLTLFRFPYPVAAAAVVGVTALVPVFGAWIGGGVGFLLALTASPLKGLLFLLFIVVLQMVDNTFIYPRIVGNSMKLEGMIVLCAVTVGGSVAGIPGMLLGVPACSVLYTLLNRAVEKRLGARHLRERDR